MIVRPVIAGATSAPDDGVAQAESAWAAIARTQSVNSKRYLLISQPDHARLSGDLAARFRADFLPKVDEATVEAIAAHDAGWAEFEFETDCAIDPPLNADGHPRSFIEFPPRVFLTVWEGSIEAAARICPLGGLMVSGHFFRLGKGHAHARCDSMEDARLVHEFLSREEQRQLSLRKELQLSPEQVAEYTDLLQFCDVLSLYLCCGATAKVEFPQQFAGKRLTIRYNDGEFAIRPSVFTRSGEASSQPIRFAVLSRAYPKTDNPEPHVLEFLIR